MRQHTDKAEHMALPSGSVNHLQLVKQMYFGLFF